MNDFVVTINNSKKEIKLIENSTLTIGGRKFSYEFFPVNAHTYSLKLNNKVYEISGERINGNKISVSIKGKYFEADVKTALQEKASELLEKSLLHSKHTEVKAPMPGLILKIKKQAGDDVAQGDSVIILEAMKMENDLRAPSSGKITSIKVKEGAAVEKNAHLFTIE